MSHPLPLGRLVTPDNRHHDSYTMRGLDPPTLDLTRPMPVAIGIPWFRDFDPAFAGGRLYKRPDGTWWLPDNITMPLRGWHEVCLKPPAMTDYPDWWRWYDQGQEGAC